MKQITPCLWFDGQAEEAVAFYLSIFPKSRILTTARYTDGLHRPAGSVMTIEFELDGQELVALNGGPQFKFTAAISMIAYCDSQAQVDRYWEQLQTDPNGGMCGWLTDKFGVSWQVVPREFIKMVTSSDDAAVKRVMGAMHSMKKLDLAVLTRAFKNG